MARRYPSSFRFAGCRWTFLPILCEQDRPTEPNASRMRGSGVWYSKPNGACDNDFRNLCHSRGLGAGPGPRGRLAQGHSRRRGRRGALSRGRNRPKGPGGHASGHEPHAGQAGAGGLATGNRPAPQPLTVRSAWSLRSWPPPNSPPPVAHGRPSVVILLASDDYPSTLKALAGPGGKPEPKAQPGGYDTIVDQDGTTYYTLKREGYLAFSPTDASLLRRMIKLDGPSVDARLSPEARDQLLAGDLGLYANIADLQEKYADQIDAARQQFMAALDQAQAQMQNDQMKWAKQFYAKMFDSLKSGQSLAMHVDFDVEGLRSLGPRQPQARPRRRRPQDRQDRRRRPAGQAACRALWRMCT